MRLAITILGMILSFAAGRMARGYVTDGDYVPACALLIAVVGIALVNHGVGNEASR